MYHEVLNRNFSYLCSSTFTYTKQKHVRRHVFLAALRCAAPLTAPAAQFTAGAPYRYLQMVFQQPTESPHEPTEKPRQVTVTKFKIHLQMDPFLESI